ncbi:MAG: aldehyde dehydrogenase family protein, partial [Crocinitomicaceae bacterium]
MNVYIDQQSYQAILKKQRDYFKSQATKSISFRRTQLKKLKEAIKQNEKKILEALKKDLGKSEEEAYLTEISIVIQEINLHLSKVWNWSKRLRVQTPVQLWPSKSYIQPEPLGISLIMAPWNYPFQLAINPLIGAISSGCCAVLKPSPFAIHTSRVIDELISGIFSPDYIKVIHGSKDQNEFILKEKVDLIFFTGSPAVGKIVMKAAAEHLTPVVLELGGKSPCIVDRHAELTITAKRIAWSKLINAGQTCIAPDYLFVHQSIKEKLLKEIIRNWETMLGNDAQQSPYFNRMIHTEAYERVSSYLEQANIFYGGKVDADDRFISPTLIDYVTFDDAIMQQEIFGPLLPVITFNDLNEVVEILGEKEKPLAMYFYGKEKTGLALFEKLSFGGGCINDGLLHVANHHIPFGGVGNSGQGRYHGKASFEAFT